MMSVRFAVSSAAVIFALAVSAEDGLLAFFSFKDGSVGSSAANAMLANSASGNSLAGKVELAANDASAAVVFDVDAPGRRIYSSSRPDAQMLCLAPQSIDISSTVEGDGVRGAEIVFAGAGTELSRHHDTGFTVEYFFKIENEDKWAQYSAKAKFTLYKEASSQNSKTFHLHLPYAKATIVRCGIGGYTSDKPMYMNNSNLPAVNDGKWHHVAIVQKAGGNLEVYFDYTRYINVVVPDTFERAEIADAAVKLACNAIAGKFSCVRMMARALVPAEFMYASPREHSVDEDGVLAFYPFDDGAVGTSAAGTNMVRDAVNPVHSPGHVIKSSSGSPTLTWDADRPGTYIYSGKKARMPIYVAPGSIRMTSSVTGSSGTIKFYGLGNDLNACKTNGHTVEYFLKLEDSNFAEYVSSLAYSAGYFYTGENVKYFNLYLPFAMGYANGRQFRYSIGVYNGGHSANRDLGFDLWNGAWHHIAVVQSNHVEIGDGGDSITNRYVSVYVDGIVYNSIPFDDIGTEGAIGDFELGRSAHHGKYSCLKITNRALRPEEFLCATERERTGMTIVVR